MRKSGAQNEEIMFSRRGDKVPRHSISDFLVLSSEDTCFEGYAHQRRRKGSQDEIRFKVEDFRFQGCYQVQ